MIFLTSPTHLFCLVRFKTYSKGVPWDYQSPKLTGLANPGDEYLGLKVRRHRYPPFFYLLTQLPSFYINQQNLSEAPTTYNLLQSSKRSEASFEKKSAINSFAGLVGKHPCTLWHGVGYGDGVWLWRWVGVCVHSTH